VFYGSAGIAVALRRVALLRSDPALSALADEWSERAMADSEEPDAFTSVELGVNSDDIGQISPYLRRSGLHATEALVAHARADVAGVHRAVGRYVATATGPGESLDITLGLGGVLLATALLLETLGDANPATSPLQELGRGTSARLWDALNKEADIGEAAGLTYLGVAHGWAGVLLASIRWHVAAGTPPPPGLHDRLDQLAGLSRTVGLGAWWPATNRRERLGWGSHAGGWCHGSAGYVHLWSTAFAAYGEPRWAELAERAGWDTYTTRSRIGQLCCGACGQAYALLALHRLTGAIEWHDRAAELACDAASLSAYHHGAEVRLPASLFKGDVGIATLGVDLAHPDEASMPFFGPDQ
jgi:serine/threonine-protein kinase